MKLTIIYPDGTTENRDLTAEELAQIQDDADHASDSAWRLLRVERNTRLAESDWTVLGDSPTPTAAWKTYRQALRDLPSNTTDPFNVDWPTPPA